MALGRLALDQDWVLAVTLNSQLVHQERIDGSVQDFTTVIDLPTDMQNATNIIEVVLDTTRGRKGVCDDGPTLLAEMRPQSHLSPRDMLHQDITTKMQLALSQTALVNVAALSEISAADADRASKLLRRIVPDDVPLKPAGTKAQVLLLSPSSTRIALPNTAPVWEVVPDTGPSGSSIRRLEGDTYEPGNSLAFLVFAQAVTVAELVL